MDKDTDVTSDKLATVRTVGIDPEHLHAAQELLNDPEFVTQYAAHTAPLSPTGAGWDPEIAQRVEALPELPDEVKAAMEKGPSDMDLLHIRLNELEELIRKNHEENGVAFKFLCDSMTWLTTMLSGVAQMAQNMPGMGGMMKAMLKGGKRHD